MTQKVSRTLIDLDGEQLAGSRNKIINGKMEVAQRGSTFTAVANATYTLDRWIHYNVTAAVGTISQSTSVPTNEFQASLLYTTTTADATVAAGDYVFIRQIIEGYNARDLVGRTFTLSFWVRSRKTGIHCVTLGNSVADRTYAAEYTVSVANTWEYKSITIPGGLILTGTWNWTTGSGLTVTFPLMVGTTFHTTPGAWQTGNFLSTANQVNLVDATGEALRITGVQLEVGVQATPFEHRIHGDEFLKCQRYYQTITWGADYFAGTGAPAIYRSMSLPVAMRAVPTTTFPAGSIAYSTTGGNQTPGSIQVTASNISSFLVIMTASPNITGWPAFGPLTFTAELA